MNRLLLITFALVFIGWIHAGDCSPFQRPSVVKPVPAEQGLIDSLNSRLNEVQKELRATVAGMVRGFKESGSLVSLLLIAGGSFLYGVIHAVGPGHGKTIVMSYLMYEKKPRLFRGILAGFIIAFGEAVSAIIIVYLVYFLALGRLTSSFLQTESRIRTIAYIAILLLGIVLFVYRLIKYRAGGETEPDSENKSRGLAVAVLLGLIPCPGVMLLLIFMLAARLPVHGVLFALCMAFGMALTISGFGVMTVMSKSWFLKLTSTSTTRFRHIQIVVELSAALLIIILAGIMLFNS